MNKLKKKKLDIMENIVINNVDTIEESEKNDELVECHRKNSEINDLEEFENKF